MEFREVIDILDRILEESRVGLFLTVDENNKPRGRWMTPALVRGREGYLYAVTSPKFRKVHHLMKNQNVEWMVQTKPLGEILHIRGKAEVIDNPSLKIEVLEAIGRNLTVFWRVNQEESDLIVVETKIDEVEYFKPIQGIREIVEVR